MYSWEIDDIVKYYNNELPSDILLSIIDPTKNKQLDHVLFKDERFHIWTKDNFYWCVSYEKKPLTKCKKM